MGKIAFSILGSDTDAEEPTGAVEQRSSGHASERGVGRLPEESGRPIRSTDEAFSDDGFRPATRRQATGTTNRHGRERKPVRSIVRSRQADDPNRIPAECDLDQCQIPGRGAVDDIPASQAPAGQGVGISREQIIDPGVTFGRRVSGRQ